MLGLSVTLMTTSSEALISPSVKEILSLKVPVTVGVPDTTPLSDPEKKFGKFS